MVCHLIVAGLPCVSATSNVVIAQASAVQAISNAAAADDATNAALASSQAAARAATSGALAVQGALHAGQQLVLVCTQDLKEFDFSVLDDAVHLLYFFDDATLSKTVVNLSRLIKY